MDIRRLDQYEYLNFLFDDAEGYASFLELPNNGEAVSYNREADEVLIGGFSGENKFVALNTFTDVKSRKTFNLQNFRAFYIDIDCYSIGNGTVSAQETLEKLQNEAFGKIVPIPNIVVFSGQGLYCIWSVDAVQKDKTKTTLWMRIENTLYSCLSAYGADEKAKDMCRVLRIPGTINAKPDVNKEVVAYKLAEDKYTFEEFENWYQSELVEKRLKAEKAKKIRTKKRQSTERRKRIKRKNLGVQNTKYDSSVRFDFIAESGKDTASIRRAQDIANVLVMQGDDAVGHRELGLFWIRYFLLCADYSGEDALNAVLRVNDALSYKLYRREVIYNTRTSPNHRYRPTVNYLRGLLGVSRKFDKELLVLCSDVEKKRRRKPGISLLTCKDSQTIRWMKEIRLSNQKMSVRKICKELGICRSTYYNDKAVWGKPTVCVAALFAVLNFIIGCFVFLSEKVSNFSKTIKVGGGRVCSAAGSVVHSLFSLFYPLAALLPRRLSFATNRFCSTRLKGTVLCRKRKLLGTLR